MASCNSEGLGCFVSFWRYVLIFINAVLMLGAVTLIIVSVVALKKNVFKSACSTCEQLYLYPMITGIVIFCVGCLGLFALWSRNRILFYVHAVLELLLFLVMIGVIIFVGLFNSGQIDNVFKNVWETMPNDTKCALEKSEKCSGWDTPCLGPIPYVSSKNCPFCPGDQAQIGLFHRTCHPALLSDLKKIFIPVLAVAAIVAALCIVTVLIGWFSVRRPPANHPEES